MHTSSRDTANQDMISSKLMARQDMVSKLLLVMPLASSNVAMFGEASEISLEYLIMNKITTFDDYNNETRHETIAQIHRIAARP